MTAIEKRIRLTLHSFATRKQFDVSLQRIVRGCVLTPLVLAIGSSAQSTDLAQKSFHAPGEASKALFEAAKTDDISALLEILGPDEKELVSSGDDVADKNDRAAFVKNYEQRHRLISAGAGRYTLSVGTSDWPLPIPIVKKENGWSFDSAARKRGSPLPPYRTQRTGYDPGLPCDYRGRACLFSDGARRPPARHFHKETEKRSRKSERTLLGNDGR